MAQGVGGDTQRGGRERGDVEMGNRAIERSRGREVGGGGTGRELERNRQRDGQTEKRRERDRQRDVRI